MTLADILRAAASGAYGSTGGSLVDTGVGMTNLARAAYGAGGRAMGLLDPSQMPDVIDPAQVPGSTANITGLLGVGDSLPEKVAQLLGGLLAPGGKTNVATKAELTAYHGTPHTFDKFDLSKIGTGEGAQAYGHGIYVADNPAVAQGYAKRLGGNTYTVDVPDEAVSNMLHWEKPLSAQPDSVKAALGAGDPDAGLIHQMPDMTGQQLYNELSLAMGGRDKAAQFLNSQGIPGVRYLDAGSRGAGDGTYNTVLFDPDLATILERQ